MKTKAFLLAGVAGIDTHGLLMAGVAQRQLCKVLCSWDQDEPVMMLGTLWKIPTSNKSKERDVV